MLEVAWQTFLRAQASYLSGVVGSSLSTAQDTTAPPTSVDDYVTLSKSEYDSFDLENAFSLYFRHCYLDTFKYFFLASSSPS